MKKIIIYIFITALLFVIANPAHAILGPGAHCKDEITGEIIGPCNRGLACMQNDLGTWQCQEAGAAAAVFGIIDPPNPIKNLGFGAKGISTFLTNIITLIYIAGGIVFLFMIIFSAFQWITSGGDKEAVGKARARITYAIIGIVILSLAFVIAKFVGDITGFKFFTQ